jgi:hypothetical protein
MSDPLTALLSKWTPDASGLDRETLLFAAGRASARPNRRWMALAAALAASQLGTILLLWLPTKPIALRMPDAVPGVANSSASADQPDSGEDGSIPFAMRRLALATESNLPPTSALDPLPPDEPPLQAVSVLRDDLLQ